MKQTSLSREQGLALLRKYNKEPFHILHGLTVEGVMEWYAEQLGYGDEKAFWGMAGLLHDIDFELYPEEHCERAPELLRNGGKQYPPGFRSVHGRHAPQPADHHQAFDGGRAEPFRVLHEFDAVQLRCRIFQPQ